MKNVRFATMAEYKRYEPIDANQEFQLSFVKIKGKEFDSQPKLIQVAFEAGHFEFFKLKEGQEAPTNIAVQPEEVDKKKAVAGAESAASTSTTTAAQNAPNAATSPAGDATKSSEKPKK